MANFPTLASREVVSEFNNALAHDPTVRSLSEGGYVTSRARFTRMTNRWNVVYMWLTQANKNTLKTFVEGTSLGGSESFSWTNPEDSVTYTVRFLGEVKYTPQAHVNFTFWTVEFVLEEV